MKIQLASDLHYEMMGSTQVDEMLIKPSPEADVLILAGDIHRGIEAVELFKDWPVPVLYVCGNHEFYFNDWASTRQALREACSGTSIRFLDNDGVSMGGVRFLGCTLWTDFRVRGFTQRQAMTAVGTRLNDYFKIRTPAGALQPEQTLEDHLNSRNWLAEQLAQPFQGATVVITHHAPHFLSVHPRFSGDVLNAGFVSDLSDLLFQPDLWVHGHTHNSSDYQVGRCRVVSNPAGYPLNASPAPSNEEIQLENRSFDPALIVEVSDKTV